MPQQLLNRPELHLLMHLITEILIIMTIFKLACNCSSKNQQNKKKRILVATQYLKIFGIDLFLNTLNLSIPPNFIHPKIRITNLDEHTFLCIYGLFADRRDVKPFSQIDI